MYGYIYLTTNNINSKMYIGQHKSNKYEVDVNYLGSGIILEKAIRKYGKDNFSAQILATADSKEDLDKLEIEYIQKFRHLYGIDNIYNIANGGQGGSFSPMTPERRRKIGQAHKGRKRDPKAVEKSAKAQIGHIVSQESRIKSRLSNLGQTRSEETRKHMSENHADFNGPKNPFWGKKHSEETLRRIGASAKGRNSGKRWVNNGIVNKIVDLNSFELGEEWKIGRIKKNLL